MTEEQLEELIKQEAEIYVVANNHIFKYKLEKKLRPFIGCNHLWVDVFNIPYDYQFNQIFETEADAEKELERQMWKEKTTAERTERFEPPMWCDAGNYIFRFVINNCFYEFYSGNIIFLKDMCGVSHFKFEQTKENYEKACEIVRGLFSGNNG